MMGLRENRLYVRRTKVTELACAIEPDTIPDGSIGDQPGAITETTDGAVQPLCDADHVQKPEPVSVEEAKEIPTSSRAPPSGWRRDDFGSPIRRSVWTPPWSLRPPRLEPEQWLSLNKRHQADERQRWRAEDPDGFATQEARCLNYIRLKNAGRVPKAAVCRSILPCDHNDLYDAPSAIGPVALSSVGAAPAPPKKDIISSGLILNSSSASELLKHAREMLVEGVGIDHLMIELCCSDKSRLAEAVPPHAVRFVSRRTLIFAVFVLIKS